MPGYIPKEQLDSYRRWQAASFDAPAGTSTEKAAPPPQAAESPPEADHEAEIVTGVALPTAEDIERIHEEARASGYDEGYQAGREAGLADTRAATERIVALGDNLIASLAGIDQTVAEEVLALAVELAGQVMRRSLAVDEDALLPVVREALAALPLHHGHVVLHVSPQDAASIRGHLGDQFSHSGWQIIEDKDIEAGGCYLRAGSSEVDATLATRWRRVLETIGAAPVEERREGR